MHKKLQNDTVLSDDICRCKGLNTQAGMIEMIGATATRHIRAIMHSQIVPDRQKWPTHAGLGISSSCDRLPGSGISWTSVRIKAKSLRDGDSPMLANGDSWADERGLNKFKGMVYFLPTGLWHVRARQGLFGCEMGQINPVRLAYNPPAARHEVLTVRCTTAAAALMRKLSRHCDSAWMMAIDMLHASHRARRSLDCLVATWRTIKLSTRQRVLPARSVWSATLNLSGKEAVALLLYIGCPNKDPGWLSRCTE